MQHDATHGGAGQMASGGMKACIQECLDCHSTCLAMVQHCLAKGGKHASAEHIGLLLACAEICRTSAAFMLLGSPHHAKTCGTCAEVCRACEQSCRAMADDAMMQQCADACRKCAESCGRMSGQAGKAA